jgi:structure-specific endonuclease subunit SLX1
MQEKLALSPLEWKFMEERKIVQQLLSCEATQEGYPTVIPKTSIGGIGKTSRARLAYNDERVTQHFDVKIWVFVSEIFYAKMITKTVTESATKKICKKEMDALQSKLWGLLHRKRYLIVLDDAWSKDHIEWGKLRPLLRGGLAGSTLIITSRSKKVAMMMDSPIFPYHLKGLDEDDCCALFRQRAFRRGEEEQDPNLLPIGKQIARKFGGLPLAAKTLGSLTRFEREDREWLLVENSELWSLNVNHGGILPSLMLSYYHLPIHLKHCFAFCSIFPKAYEIKEKLIHLWMAEGFLQEGSNHQKILAMSTSRICCGWFSFKMQKNMMMAT